MKWRGINEHVIESDAGYRVLECTAEGIPTGRYVAFIGKTTPTWMSQVLGGYSSGEEARQACIAHLSKTQQEMTA